MLLLSLTLRQRLKSDVRWCVACAGVFYTMMNPSAASSDYGSVVERLAFKKQMQCKSYRWYLENIYPESLIPVDFYSVGQVRLVASLSFTHTHTHTHTHSHLLLSNL